MPCPTNCLTGKHSANRGTISFCRACYDEAHVMTNEERAVIEACIAVSMADGDDGSLGYIGDIALTDAMDEAVGALLEAQPEWDAKEPTP